MVPNGTIWEIYQLCLQSKNLLPALRGRRRAGPVGQTHEGTTSLYVLGLAASLMQLTKERRSEKANLCWDHLYFRVRSQRNQ